MLTLTDAVIRSSFLNATRKELSELAFAPDLPQTDWDAHDYYGWRDPKLAKRAYLVVPLETGPVGIVLKQADGAPRSRAQCSWCQDIRLPNDVVLFSARRSGAAGRKGDTVGILVCSEFQCSANVRKLPPVAYLGFDVEAARLKRIEVLGERSRTFAEEIARGA